MAKSTKNLPAISSKIKDTAPELDDIRTIVLDSRDAPTPRDIALVEGMASHLLTPEEICSVIRVPKGRFEKHLEFQAAYQRGYDLGKASIRRMQFLSAKTQPVMQIWLGKQYLGQADKVEAPQGESQTDAYKGFLDKLNLVINVHTEGRTSPKVVGAGKGDSEILLEDVGKDSATPTEQGAVVRTGESPEVDSGVAAATPRTNLHRLMEDMVVPSGTGKRQDESGGGVGQNAR